MKRVFPLNESLSSSTIKKYKEIIPNKTKEKENQKMKSPFPLRRDKRSENKSQYSKKHKNYKKTPGKTRQRITIKKILDNNNECNKTNSTIINPNDKQLFLVACLLGNNRNNNNKIQNNKTNNLLTSMKKSKEFKKYVNKIQRGLIPRNKQNNERKKNSKINLDNYKKNVGIIDINIKNDNNTNNNNCKDKNNNNIFNEKKESIENIIKKEENLNNPSIDNNPINSKDLNNKANNNIINKNIKIINKPVILHKNTNKESNKQLFIKKDNINMNNINININKDNIKQNNIHKENNKPIINNKSSVAQSNKDLCKDDEQFIKSYNNKIEKCRKSNIHNDNLKIFVNTSYNIKETEKTNKKYKRIDLSKSVNTPKNIFKKKIMNITNKKNVNNKLNKSDNLESLKHKKNSSVSITKKNSVKSYSLEKFINNKKPNINNLSFSKNLFKLTKNNKLNQSSNFFLIPNNTRTNKFLNRYKDKRNIKENQSCDNFYRRENSVDNGKINIKTINDNNNEEKINKNHNNTISMNKNKFLNKKNLFKNSKLSKKFKKHKSQDLNSKSNLNTLIISQNDLNNVEHKKDNKTPQRISPKLIKSFKKEVNHNIHVINSNNNNNINSKKQNYTYNILPGNNGKLVEKCLLNRNKWEIATEDKKNFCNFIWTPLSSQINYYSHSTVENAQFVNHFEYHSELTNKSKTFINLFRYCEFNEINLFSFYPLTIIITFNPTTFNAVIENFKKFYNDVPHLIFDEQDKEKNKEMLNKNYIDYFNVNLSKKIGSIQKMKIPKTHYIGKNMWLLKRDNLNRGRKIKVLSNLDDIIKEISALYEQKSTNNLLIQKYIEQPLLYHKRKFDIRIWVLFTFINCENKYEVYVFKEGHLKACSDEFDIHSDDLFIHLTNYSVQKHNKNFSKTEIGNEISFNEIQNELNEKHKIEGKNNNNIDFRKDIFPEIIKIITVSANAVKGKINLSNRNNCFEIFGYDFILDINYRPFLLEINTNPGYEESSPLIKMLVPRMIDDAMKLTIDKEFETTYKTNDNINENLENNQKKSRYEVEGYSSEENMWLKIKTKL